jgi:DegV family protein with EDD domain
MAGVAIVSDSTHYLPRELVAKHEIHEVSLYVRWGERSQRELDMDGFAGFYERLRTDPELPTTSQPSIGDFLAVWEPLVAAGREIVSVHLAGGISGTCETARQAQAILAERHASAHIEVLDSETGCGGLGLVLLAAASAASSGASMAEVVEHVRQARRSLDIWFCIDTLEYLRRGGRVGRAQAWLGSTMKIKPILTLGYEITPVERVRTAGRAFERMVRFGQELYDSDRRGWAVQHIRAPEQMQRLVERCEPIFGSQPVFASEVGPVIGTYTGPGLLGVGAISLDLLS